MIYHFPIFFAWFLFSLSSYLYWKTRSRQKLSPVVFSRHRCWSSLGSLGWFSWSEACPQTSSTEATVPDSGRPTSGLIQPHLCVAAMPQEEWLPKFLSTSNLWMVVSNSPSCYNGGGCPVLICRSGLASMIAEGMMCTVGKKLLD